jgi:hypothetical protein
MSLGSLVSTGSKVWLDGVEPEEVKNNRPLGTAIVRQLEVVTSLRLIATRLPRCKKARSARQRTHLNAADSIGQ